MDDLEKASKDLDEIFQRMIDAQTRFCGDLNEIGEKYNGDEFVALFTVKMKKFQNKIKSIS